MLRIGRHRRCARAGALAILGLGAALLLGVLSPATAVADVCQEPNDRQVSACFLPAGAAVPGSIGQHGDVDVYKIEVPPGGSRVELRLAGTAGGDLDLYLADEQVTILGYSVHEGPGEYILTTLPGGTYYAHVSVDRARGQSEQIPYDINLNLSSTISLECLTGTVRQADLGSVTGRDVAYYEQLQSADEKRAYRFNVREKATALVKIDDIPYQMQMTMYARRKCGAGLWDAAPVAQWLVDGSAQRPDGQLLPALDPDEYLVLVGHLYAEDPEFATDFEPGRGFTIHISVR